MPYGPALAFWYSPNHVTLVSCASYGHGALQCCSVRAFFPTSQYVRNQVRGHGVRCIIEQPFGKAFLLGGIRVGYADLCDHGLGHVVLYYQFLQ